MNNKSCLNTFFLSLLFLLSACSRPYNTTKEQLNIEKPLVITTFTVLADLARNVAGDRLTVRSITKVGSEIHGYSPTPSDLINANGANLIIANGFGIDRWADKFVDSLGDIHRVILSDGMEPLLIEGDEYAGKPNPHVWMSPKRTMEYVDKLQESFSILDPLGKDDFARNADTYKSKLKSLDKELRDSLALIPVKRRVLVSCEGAFSYLANDYGMQEAYLWPVNSESQVTPRRMLNLISKVRELKIPTIFCESTVSSKAQLEVAKASGASFGGTFFVDSLSEANGPAATLLDLQRHNVKLIVDGLLKEKS